MSGNHNSPSLISKIWRWGLRKFLGTQIYKFHYLTFDTSKYIPKHQNVAYEIKEDLTLSDFKTGDAARLTPSKIRIINQRLNSPNYKCFGIIEHGELLYSTWVALNQITLPNGMVTPLNDDEALLEDSYCEPKARGRHFHSEMNYFRMNYLTSIGKKTIITIVLDGNTPAMKVQQKCGFRAITTFYSGKLFGRAFSTLKKGPL